jgi:hypothetical protein
LAIQRPEEFVLRKLVAAIAFLAVAVLPATAVGQPHWYRGEETQVTVYVNRCPSSYHCVKVYQVRSARNMAGWATLNYDPRSNTAWYGTLHLNTRYLTTAAARRKTACHELGHIFGLDHRRSGRTCMRDGFATMYGHPDAADFANLRQIYANAAA